jgi:NAD(P)-dependent dehydrogenase (short-subunit alcohol dehydrogenase family)
MLDMSERVCLVTGATSGIGYVVARELVRRGAAVTILARRAERAEASRSRIAAETGAAAPEILLCDFASLASVRRAAAQFIRNHDRLHVLVNNAGLVHAGPDLTEDGFEMTFQVNHLAPFLFTNLLLDTLIASVPARVVTVSSGSHRIARTVRLDDLSYERRRYRAFPAYAESKLANVLFAYELARRLEGTGVTSNAVHPGGVRTGFGMEPWGLSGLFWKAMRPLLLTPERGAETLLHAATADGLAGVTGVYLAKSSIVPSSDVTNDRALAERLWETSENLVGLGGAS